MLNHWKLSCFCTCICSSNEPFLPPVGFELLSPTPGATTATQGKNTGVLPSLQTASDKVPGLSGQSRFSIMASYNKELSPPQLS